MSKYVYGGEEMMMTNQFKERGIMGCCAFLTIDYQPLNQFLVLHGRRQDSFKLSNSLVDVCLRHRVDQIAWFNEDR